ncbi:acyltransferase [Acidobacterium sp. S8]|uniref:acyltransferase family protein n=1 Tax=Acidobacterium sp. S8 TaxID=1641854 RepID=UPI00131DF493|nr:acyltransferase [Acidobacterium sp. S8]
MATIQLVGADAAEPHSKVARRFYRPELDALRFFAFLAVYVCHSIPNSLAAAGASGRSGAGVAFVAAIKDTGNFGVCLFFLLSAFLITELLRREDEAYGPIDIGSFYLRRILRIWPLYFGITIAYWLGGYFFPALRLEPGRVISYFLLAGNWYIALHPWIQTPLRSLWSISVEEQFYLAWPLLAHYGGMRALAKASLVLVPLSLLTIYVVSSDKSYAHNTVWVNSFTQFQFFAWGALLALALDGKALRIDKVLRGTMWSLGISLWMFAAHAIKIKRAGVDVLPSQYCFGYLLVAAGSMLLLLAVLGISNGRVPRWAVYLGKISFGLYVFHETAFLIADEVQKHTAGYMPSMGLWPGQDKPALLVLNKIFSLGITVLLAVSSYHFWEIPFLRLKERFTWVRSREV